MLNNETSFVLSRASSGILNGGFYSGSYFIGVTGYVLTIVFTFLSIRQTKVILKLSLFLSLLSISFVLASFLFPAFVFADIHLWTLLTQTFQAFAMFVEGKKWWRMLLLVSPSVFFQKLFINLFGGNKWWHQGTNVSSGKYYTILGKIRIPRILSGNMYVRLVMTLISLTILQYGKIRSILQCIRRRRTSARFNTVGTR